jgi:hypothetical protein
MSGSSQLNVIIRTRARSVIVDERWTRRRKILERLNACDSGPHEDDRRAAKQAEIRRELVAEFGKMPTFGRRVLNGV